MRLDLDQRAKCYNETFPDYPPLVVAKGWIYGVWMMGWNYRGSGYYGSYPPSYLKRVMSMYPDATKILHLFSGSLGSGVVGDRFDIDPGLSPDIVGDAHQLSDYVSPVYDLIIADPPYSDEDARHYGTPMVNRNTVVRVCKGTGSRRSFGVVRSGEANVSKR